jgi:ribonucleoside-diphosphate reductase alpha chain
VRDELKLSLGAVVVLKERYLRRDEAGKVLESTGEMMDRVASVIAQAEERYEGGSGTRWGEEFARALRGLLFLPNSPTLMNAGTKLGLLSACFVLPIEDSLASIFGTLRTTALVHQAGGGTGFSFSRVRPAGDRVATTGGIASGPLSFLGVYDVATDVIRQGGRRRGANMAVLDVSHPDIREFAAAKSAPGRLENFNLSVAVTDRFMRSVIGRGDHRLVNPRTGRTVANVPAYELFDAIVAQAWSCGDPGLVFIDRVNRGNPLRHLGRIEATNPCGEVPLLANESCNLGSINLAKVVRGQRVEWALLDATTRLAVRFLDDVIDVNCYPDPDLEAAARRTRKIGLGFMGLAEMLASLGIPYDSDRAVRLAGRIARRIHVAAVDASAELAKVRGAYPEFERSTLASAGRAPLRNAQLTSVAPTGTISLLAGTTSGIEPMFAVAYVRNVVGRRLIETNPLFERTARRRGFYSDALMQRVAQTGTVGADAEVPEDVARSFVTALEIAPEWHLRMQAAVQRHVDASVSKTVNLPAGATTDDVQRVFLDAWRLGLKGVTVYRYGSRPDQTLTYLTDAEAGPSVRVSETYAGGCAGRECEF